MERLARDCIEGLLDRNVQPLVMTRKADATIPPASRLEQVRVFPVWFVPGKLRDRYFSWRAGIVKRAEHLDALIAFNRTENADIVVCGGTHCGFLAETGKKPGLADRLHVTMERKQYATAKIIIANSLLMRDEVIRYYQVKPEQIVVLYPTVDLNRFKPADKDTRRALRERFGFSPDKRVFVFPSGDHMRKGLPFIRPFFEHTDLPVELVVAGRDAPSGRNIRSLGFVENIEHLFQAADATILASGYEPFGMVGVESVCCGTPAVLADTMGCAEVMSEPGIAKFSLSRPESLPEAIAKALTFDRSRASDLRQCIAYDMRKEYFVDQLLHCLDIIKV